MSTTISLKYSNISFMSFNKEYDEWEILEVELFPLTIAISMSFKEGPIFLVCIIT